MQKSRTFGLPEQQARALIGIARLLKKEDADQSIQYLQNALVIAERLNSHKLKADIYLVIAGIYKQKENYREALTALEAHQKLLNHIFSKEKRQAIEQIEAQERRELEHLIFAVVFIFIILIATAVSYYIFKKNAVNEALQSSNQIKDKLFSIIGHDLRGPAGGIMEALDMIDTGILNQEEEKEIIALLKKQSRAFNETLNSLLQWASTQLNGALTHKSEFDPKFLVAKTLEVLQGHVSRKKLQIEVNVPDNLSIMADPDHFEFIFRNLLSNAIKFSTEQGCITIMANKIDKEVVLSIKDQGVGIPEEKQKHFQRKNFMETTFGTSGEKGTGLGLMLCKEFVLANNGRLWLDSVLGKGTIFYFSLPTT